MRQILAVLMVGAVLALATSAALAYSPSVDGTVTQVFVTGNGPNGAGGTSLIAVDGTPYAVPFDFYANVRIGDTVQFDGMNWSIVK